MDEPMEIKEEVILTEEMPENAPSSLCENNLDNVMVRIKNEVGGTDLEEDFKKEVDGDLLMEFASEDSTIESEVKTETEDVEIKLEQYLANCDEERCEIQGASDFEPTFYDSSVKREPEKFYREGFLLKQEQDLQDVTITETQLISNKVINTTSTITSPLDGIIESQTTNTLIMQILPLPHANIGHVLDKIHNPEKILPTCSNDDDVEYEDTYEVNTIISEIPIEHEALTFMKSKQNDDVDLKPFQCTKCIKSYSSKKSLTRHMQVHDCVEKRLKGIMRGIKTKQDKTEKKKIKVEKLEVCAEVKPKKEGYECTCGRVFRRRSRMETCLRSHNSLDSHSCYSCISCTKAFADKEDLAQHRKRLHRKRFSCKFCPTDYNSRKELFKHLQIHQKVQLMEYKVISEVVKGNQKLKCFMCSKTCTELSVLKSHVLEDHHSYKCPRCKKTFPKLLDCATHTKTCNPVDEGKSILDVLEAFSLLVKDWRCEECDVQFHEADKLALHQLEKHSPDVKTELQTQFQCPDCQRVFATQKGLKSHRRVHETNEVAEEVETVDKGIMCLECRKMCKDMEALTSHMRFHSPDRKYPCKFCDFRFASVEKRRAHAEIHTGDMKFVCFICEYQCSSAKRLKHHKLSVKHLSMQEYLLTGKPLIEEPAEHKKEKEKKKALIKEVEKKRKKERAKSNTRFSLEEPEVPCDICGEKFASERIMLNHKETHPFIEFPNDDQSKIFFK